MLFRWSGASRVWVTLDGTGPDLRVEVGDDGPVGRRRGRGPGMLGGDERLQAEVLGVSVARWKGVEEGETPVDLVGIPRRAILIGEGHEAAVPLPGVPPGVLQ